MRPSAALASCLLLASLGAPGCSDGVSAGIDAGVTDAGVTDAGTIDAGLRDGGSADAGIADAGSTDAGVTDAGLADAGAAQKTWDPSANAIDEARFPLGVQVGDVTPVSAILWTRYAGAQPIYARVVEEGTPPLRVVGDYPVQPADGYAKVDVGGLRPAARYRLVYLEEGPAGARSTEARFVTPPLPETPNKVHFGATSCTKQAYAPFAPLRQASFESLDLFLLLGDTTYNDDLRTRDEYRERWRANLATTGYRSLFASTSHVATWDDHEVANNFNPETVDPVLLESGRESFFENLAIRRPAAPNQNRIWRSFRWGKAVEVFVLDCRGERLPSTRTSPNAQYVSPAQLAWLEEGLRTSTAAWKVVANSVPITNFPLAFDVQASDRWEGYAAQRDALLGFITQNALRGVVFVSGDFHIASVARLEPSGPLFNYYEILAGPGGQLPNPAYLTLSGSQFELASPTNNVVIFDADATVSPPTLRFRFLDGSGGVFFDKTITP